MKLYGRISDSTRYYFLLVGAFLFEASGYLAFPYLSLQLRDRFGFAPVQIGQILMLAIWIRPVAALAGGFLDSRVAPLVLFSCACLAEGACFLLLGSTRAAFWAVLAVLLGNIGFSIVKPSIFALAYDEKDGEASTSKLALLNGITNSGAAFGCLLSGLITHFNVSAVFLAAGTLFPLLIPLFIPVLSMELHPSQVVPGADAGAAKNKITPWFMSPGVFPLILATLGFWASYSQFNLYFSLFSSDWLRDPRWTGAAFAAVTVLVAVSSLALSRWRSLSGKLHRLTIVVTVVFALSWLLLVSFSAFPAVVLFIISISVCEALFATLLADSWGRLVTGKKQLMQSLNFVFRSLGMGAGGLLGGWTYRTPSQGSLSVWGVQNMVLLALTVVGVMFSRRLSVERISERSS